MCGKTIILAIKRPKIKEKVHYMSSEEIDLFPVPRIQVTGVNQTLIDSFISTCVKSFKGKADPTFNRVYKITIGNRFAYVQNNWMDLQHNPSMIIVLTENGAFEPPKLILPTLVLQINQELMPERVVNDIHILSYRSISHDMMHSCLSYSISFHDCYKFGLHTRGQVKPVVKLLLHRVFRALDTNFDGKIQMFEFSKFHENYFGLPFDNQDMLTFFKALHDGAEPASVSQFFYSFIRFESFLQLMQYLVSRGYGASVLQLIRCPDYYYYFDESVNCQELFFGGTQPKRLSNTSIAVEFLRQIYSDFGGENIMKQVHEEFSLSGGTPERFANVREMGEDTWISRWIDWSAVSPSDACRQLLSLGFPPDMIYEAFEVPKPDNNKSVGLIAGISSGILAASALWYYFYTRR